MLQNFEIIPPLFEGQANESCQFKVNIQGNDYRGIYHKEEVQWYQPLPNTEFGEDDLFQLESKVRALLANRIIKENPDQ